MTENGLALILLNIPHTKRHASTELPIVGVNLPNNHAPNSELIFRRLIGFVEKRTRDIASAVAQKEHCICNLVRGVNNANGILGVVRHRSRQCF